MMNEKESPPDLRENIPPTRWQRVGPVITLLLLAPVISEVLYGATRISFLFALIPEIGIWGCGALIIRHVVRQRRRGWVSLLLLGLALAVAEECIIQQTSLAPLIGSGSTNYGRAAGVNWIYLLWALGYESIWAVLVPIQLTELLFPSRRQEPWMRRRGLAVAAIAFGLASFVAWFTWTQQARPKVFHLPPYDPPLSYLGLALVVIALFVWAAFALPDLPAKHLENRWSPRPWLVGLAVFGLGCPWGTLVLLGYGLFPRIPAGLVMGAALVWAASTFLLLKPWPSSPAWQDTHRFALVSGAVMACMVSGFVVFVAGGALPLDWIGKIILNVAAIAALLRLGWKIKQRQEAVVP